MNKHLRNNIVHTAEKNSSGLFWNGNSNRSVLDRNGMVAFTLPYKTVPDLLEQFYLCSVNVV